MSPDQPGYRLILVLSPSLPLAPVLITLQRRGLSWRPNLTAIIGGLACSTAAPRAFALSTPTLPGRQIWPFMRWRP
jgi:hypothetical protein